MTATPAGERTAALKDIVGILRGLQQQRRTTPPAARPSRRRHFALLGLVIGLVLGMVPWDGVPGGNPVELAARPYHFDIISWEVRQIAAHLPQLAGVIVPPGRSDRAAEERAVASYFLLVRNARAADIEAQRLRDTGTPEQARAAAVRAADLEAQRAAAEKLIAPIIARHISDELLAEGLEGIEAGPLRTPFPPVSFEMTRPPSVLVVSPRNEMRLLYSIVLRPGMTLADMERVEASLEARGFSVIVEPTGGFSTYPAMVPETGQMEFTLSSITHEWLHAYFFLGPLGQRYSSSSEMRSINETAADLGGNEIGARLAERYRRRLPQPLPAPPAPAQPAAPQPPPPPFDFTKEMRATRVQAEAMLKAGQIEEAERYMEERRLVFVRRGYLLRKLNQAYFAFHGTYADSPGSVSPIAGYLHTIRERAGSMGAFVRQMRQIGSHDELMTLLDAGAPDGAERSRSS